MYSTSDHGAMIADTHRIDAYARALRQAIVPSSVVLDLGAGTGIFSLLACRYGARRVYAIEPDEVIQVAREHAVANHCADRIHFYHDYSTRMALPEPVDVIISDLRGVTPFFRDHIPAIQDARERLLRPGGRLIAQRDELWAAPVEAPASHARFTRGHANAPEGLDCRAALRYSLNNFQKVHLRAEQVLAAPRHAATLNYTVIKILNLRTELAFDVRAPGLGHGLAVWFDSVLAEGISFSNAPGRPELIYGQLFLPWPSAVPLEKGDLIEVLLRADLVGSDYVWRWDTHVAGKASFQQSTFLGAPLDPTGFRKRSDRHVPAPNEACRIDRFILSRIDGKASVGEIARQAAEQFPDRFPRWEDALARVGELALRYSRQDEA